MDDWYYSQIFMNVTIFIHIISAICGSNIQFNVILSLQIIYESMKQKLRASINGDHNFIAFL